MFLTSLRRRSKRGLRSGAPVTQPGCFRPRLERLEDRLAPATITDLGTLPGFLYSEALGINASGQVVGDCSDSTGRSHAFLHSAGMMTDLGTLGGPNSLARGINGSGQVIGYSDTSAGYRHAFLDSNGVMTDLGAPPGSALSYAEGINDSGLVAGQADRPGTQGLFPTLYNGGWTYLGTPATPGDARAINDAGQVAGSVRASSGQNHAFLYSNGVLTDLGTLGGQESAAEGINAAGQVVGYYSTGSSQRPFLYSNGVMADLSPSDPLSGSALGINSSGDVVGTGGFFYRNGVITYLSDFLPPASGWTSFSAYAINDARQIVGFGYHNGQDHAFLFDLSQCFQWTGQGPDNLWSDGANWVGGTAPTPGADLVFPRGALQMSNVNDLGPDFGTVLINGGAYTLAGQPITPSGLLNVKTGASLELDCPLTADGPIQMAFGSNLTVGATGRLDLDGGGSSSAPITVAGTLTTGPGSTFSAFGRLTVAGTLTTGPGSTFSAGDTVAVAASGTLTIGSAGTFSATSQFSVSPTGTLTVQDSATADLGRYFTNFSTATRTLQGGTYQVQGTLRFAGNGLVTNAAQLTLDGPTARVEDSAHNDQMAALAHNAVGAALTVQNGYVLSSTAAAMQNDGSLTVGSGGTFTATGPYTQGGELTIMPGGTANLENPNFGGPVSDDGTLSVTDGLTVNGVLDVGSNDGSSAGTVSFTDSMTVDGSEILLGPNPGNALSIANDNTTVTLGPTELVHGSGRLTASGVNRIFALQGPVSAADPGMPLEILPGVIEPSAVVEAVAQGATIRILSGTWTNNGTLRASNGGTIIAESLPTNLSGGTLTGGTWQVYDQSTIQFPLGGNLIANTVQASVLLDGGLSRFVDVTGVDLFEFFTSNGPGSTLSIQNYRNFTTTVVAGFDFSNLGTLVTGFPTHFVVLYQDAGHQLVNAGTLGLGGLMDVYSDVHNVGTVDLLSTGVLSVHGGYTQTDGRTDLNGGVLQAEGLVDLQGGVLDGAGSIDGSVRNAAEIDVGYAGIAGLLFIDGNYTQTAAGTLAVKVGASNVTGTAGVDFDQLQIATGQGFQATLDGTLQVTLINGYLPNSGEAVTVMTFDSRSGSLVLTGDGMLFSDAGDQTDVTLVAN